MKKENKNNMETISLVTSRDNYFDPRIIFAFMKNIIFHFKIVFL